MSDALSTPPSLWERVIEVFDPAEPAGAALRAPRENYNPVSENIVKRLRARLPHQKFALAGGIGSGKTTELRATLQRIAPHKVVVFLDLLAHFERGLGGVPALNRLKVGELIGLLGLAVARLAEDDALPEKTPSALISDLQDALTALNRAVHGASAPALSVHELAQSVALLVGGLSGAAAGAALTGGVGAVAGASAGFSLARGAAELGLKTFSVAKDTFGWRVGSRAPAEGDQETIAEAALRATNALLDNIRVRAGRDVVLIIDGLDRIEDNDTFKNLLVESSLLAELRCDAVVSMQLGLYQRHSSRLSKWSYHVFTFVPVVDRDQPEVPNTKGLQFFEELVARRFEAVCPGVAPVSAAQVRRLAYSSGGRLRDFMKLMTETAVEALLDDAPRAEDEHVRRAIDTLRREREEGLNSAELDLLTELLADPRRRLPDGQIALDLLQKNCLLVYPNESKWYLPHPLLMMHILKPLGSKG
ncbi:hypothetical protein L6R49_28060 [Myxococcota bacterium]|nr:hypothetical protein [Myxococcota bacterium]